MAVQREAKATRRTHTQSKRAWSSHTSVVAFVTFAFAWQAIGVLRRSRPCSSAILDTPAAVMRAVVMTSGTRVSSLNRLMRSLCNLDNCGDRIDVDVWIDVPDGVLSPAVRAQRWKLKKDIEELGKNGTYRHGLVQAHIWEQHAGMRGQWIDTWHRSTPGGLRENSSEIGLLLEDDLELSPYAWRWLKAAHAAYGHLEHVAGFTLQRVHLCAARCPDLDGGPDGAGGGFLYPLHGTWGYSPTAKSYSRFRSWYYNLPPDFKPYVEGLTPTDWYKAFEREGTEKKVSLGRNILKTYRLRPQPSFYNPFFLVFKPLTSTQRMWDMHYLKYTNTHADKYTVYVKCPGNATLAVNHREVGENYKVKEVSPHYVLKDWHANLVHFAQNPITLDYRAQVIRNTALQ
jgi:hypothetical protein